ncbi:MAG: cytochrome-c peroxidase [Proteobacteria bacterium]|nr:cytochrome-c peroxidase [Pseudomonadota bacterium]
MTFLCIAFTSLVIGCSSDDEDDIDLRNSADFAVLTANTVDADIAALGKKLYEDKQLSGDGTVSCMSCHDVAKGGDDGRPTSLGINDQEGPINAPTVLNASYNVLQFWDGRAATLEDQAGGPIENPKEMGGNIADVIVYLKGDTEYSNAFAAAFSDGVTEANIRFSIAEYERTLVTLNSPFDQYLSGDDDAMSEAALRGAQLFAKIGCSDCHNGPALGGSSFEKLGVAKDYFKDRGNVTEADYGRYNVTANEAHRHQFKVPTLRNIELTDPYLHDGTVTTLDEAIRKMATYQLDMTLEDDEVSDLTAFLKALTGEIPGA